MAKFAMNDQGHVVTWGPFTTLNDVGAGEKAVAAITANTTNLSTTINVTAIAGAPITVGMEVTGTGIPAGTTVSALGTGTGGTGTYVLSAAATATATGVAVTGTSYTPGYLAAGRKSLSVQVNGTFGTGGAVQMQGSNDGVNWYQLSDLGGTAISITAAGYKGIRDFPVWIRPALTAGTGTISLTVSLGVG